jgi:hypothetical protein
MMDERDDPYLWDRSGDEDPEIARLETLLQPLAHRRALGELPARETETPVAVRRRGAGRVVGIVRNMAAAAAAVVLGFGLWFASSGLRGGWDVVALDGQPVVDGISVSAEGVLRRGGSLVTDGRSRARIHVGQIGRVDVDPGSRLALVAAGVREHRLSLESGTIHARIWAPPRFFFVNTPSAEAIDLGCAFTLHVDGDGAGLLRVTHGWVQFAYDGREAFIPQGAVGATRPGFGPGTPRFEDAPSLFTSALDLLDFGKADGAERAAALDQVLSSARPRDALTLWHLLSRGSAAERGRVYDRLSALTPPPSRATREAVLRGDRKALMAWWDSFEFEGTSFWSRLRSRF